MRHGLDTMIWENLISRGKSPRQHRVGMLGVLILRGHGSTKQAMDEKRWMRAPASTLVTCCARALTCSKFLIREATDGGPIKAPSVRICKATKSLSARKKKRARAPAPGPRALRARAQGPRAPGPGAPGLVAATVAIDPFAATKLRDGPAPLGTV